MSQFQFELVSPEEKLISEDIKMVVIPGVDGDFGVLKDHTPLVASVRTGVVDIYRENIKDVSERIFIAGGFADVTGDGCTLLAEQAINVNDLDKVDIDRQITDIKQDIEIIEDEADKKRFHKKLDILRAMSKFA